MKKLIPFIFIALLFASHAETIYACSPALDIVYPTIDSMLLQDSTAIALLTPSKEGSEVTSHLIIGNENSNFNMNLKLDNTSCGTRFNDFTTDEYIVAVFKKGAKNLDHFDLDNQFSFAFSVKSDAVEKYTELSDQWEKRIELRSESNLNSVQNQSTYTPTSYTLKPGMEDEFVLALQMALKVKLNLDETFKLDSKYGPSTAAAVKQLQIAEGINGDGLAGVVTQGKLTGTNANPVNIGLVQQDIVQQDEVIEVVAESNNDIVDAELRKILKRAKNEIINYAVNIRNYTDAHSLVIKYNNEVLAVYAKSDPLYKSSNGGKQFIYFTKLVSGKYICVDNNLQKEIIETSIKPNLDSAEVSC